MEADTYRFLKGGKPFVPLIAPSLELLSEGHNGVIIELDASLCSELDWKIEGLEEVPGILWKINFGWDQNAISLTDELAFRSFQLALDHFMKTLYEPFKEKTLGVIVYEGEADLSGDFIWNEALQEMYEEDKKESVIFCMERLSEYLHQLITLLADDLLIFAQFDATMVKDSVLISHLFSKEAFPFILPIVKGALLPQFGIRWESGAMRGGYIGPEPIAEVAPLDSQVGFVMPERLDSEKIRGALSRIMGPYRLIHESVLAESWDELETLYVVDELMTVMGKRKLKAFEAAGGRVEHSG